MATVVLVVWIFILCIINGDFCVFEDESGSTETKLHLEWFPNNNRVLEQLDIGDYKYFYSVCRNDVSCGSGQDSTGQIEQSASNNICYIVSRFDDTIQPIYNSTTQQWIFYYENGWDFDCQFNRINRTVTIYWHCNMSTDGIITNVTEPDDPCEYIMYIESKWACLGMIPPSNNNDNDDKFWEDELVIIISSSCLIGVILIIVVFFISIKRCQKRKEIKDLINDILKDDDDYGATGTDIDIADNISDISKMQHLTNSEEGNARNKLLTTTAPLYE